MGNFFTCGFPGWTLGYKIYNDSLIRVKIQDTCDDQRYSAINQSYYKRADSIIMVYDITSKSSFELCKTYYKERIKELCKNNIKVILVGNKNDMENQREINSDEAAMFASENGYLFMETSCLKYENVYEVFETIILLTFLNKKKGK
jgi:small GTP-binding protein